MSCLVEHFWCIDGHHHTLADRSHPIPAVFKDFSGYNKPESYKHQKRSHRNMSADALQKHVGGLRSFLLAPWIKKRAMVSMRKHLITSIDFYVGELAAKRRYVRARNEDSSVSTASDDTSLCGEIGNYNYIWKIPNHVTLQDANE